MKKKKGEGFAEIESDDSGESMEPVGEVPLVGLGESELERIVRVHGEKPEVDSRDEGKHTGIRNDLLFAEKPMI